jgi:drug/metabolite transporter (DMT)-like permease
MNTQEVSLAASVGFVYAIINVFIRKLGTKNSLHLTLYRLSFMLILFGLSYPLLSRYIGPSANESLVKSFTWSDLGTMVIISGLTLITFILPTYLLRSYEPQNVSPFFSSSPFWTLLISFFFLGKKYSIYNAIGGVLFVISCVLIVRDFSK